MQILRQILAKLRSPGVFVRLVFIIIILGWPLFSDSQFTISVMVVAGLMAIMAIGLSLLLATAGQISLGQAVFFGIGAFGSVTLTMKYHVPALLSLFVAAVLSGVVAFLIGRPILRLKSYFLAIATLGLGTIFMVLARQTKGLTGGQAGIVGIPWFNIGSFEFDSYIRQYFLVWVVALIILFFTERALASRVGRALRALAVSEVAASTLGIRTADWKLRTFVVSAIFAGIGGGLYGFTMMSISFASFDPSMSMIVMIMIIVGGPTVFSGVIGAIALTWLGQAFTQYHQFSGILYAIVLLMLLLFLPGGLAGGMESRPVLALRKALAWLGNQLFAWLRRSPQTDAGGEPSTDSTVQAGGHGTAIESWQLRSEDEDGRQKEAQGEPLLRLEGVSVSFGGIQAVNQVSTNLQSGAIVALIGPNGAGKSTLFNVISGVQKPTKGRVWFRGREITRMPTADIARLGMARTFQNLRIFWNMSVLENVMVGRHRHESAGFITAALGMKRAEEKESRRRAMEALALVGLQHLANWPVTALSYGQQRLVEIARALATEPKLLLLDEPAAGMNGAEREQLIEKVVRIRKAGVTVLLVEHDMHLVMGISDRVSVLDYGSLIAEGKPQEVQANPAVIEAYVGTKRERRQVTDSGGLGDKAGETGGVAVGQSKALLEVRDISTFYGSIGAIQGVSFEVYPGEILAVLGSNGAGKTTLLRTISGLLRPRSGSILYENRDLTRVAPQKISTLGIGHVPEGRMIFPTLSVEKNLMLGACMRRDKAEVRKDWEFVYDLLPRLAERRLQIAGTLSGGEQQMLAIGRALMGKPKVLLLDEPSMGLAPLIVELIFETLVKLNQQGLALVIVEQNAEMVLSVAHRAVVLQTGKVALSGRAVDLSRDERVRGLYLGSQQGEADGTPGLELDVGREIS